MFSKIFAKSAKVKNDKKEGVGVDAHKHTAASTSTTTEEVSPHHIYYPLQLQQQQQQQQHHYHHHLQQQQRQQRQQRQQQQQIYDNYANQQQQQQLLLQSGTATTLDSPFHPSKLVADLSESPGRSRKLRRGDGDDNDDGRSGRRCDDDDDEAAAEAEKNLQNEISERALEQQQEQLQQQQQQNQQLRQQLHKDTNLDGGSSLNEVTLGANMTYDCCHSSEPSNTRMRSITMSPKPAQYGSHHNCNTYSTLTKQVQPMGQIYPTKSTPDGHAKAAHAIPKGHVTSTRFNSLLNINSRSANFATPRSMSFRNNSSQQDLQQFDLLQQSVQQQQNQLQQQQQLLQHVSHLQSSQQQMPCCGSEKEVRFYPVRYRSLSAGDQTNLSCHPGAEYQRTDQDLTTRSVRLECDSEEKWGARGEKMRGSGVSWGNTKKYPGSIQTSSASKSTSSEQFYRSIIGQVFLICGKEMKRCVLLQKISSLDAVRQIFSQAFSDMIKVDDFYGPDPALTVYILDTVAAVFYELEDYRDVRNLSVLKIFEKRLKKHRETAPIKESSAATSTTHQPQQNKPKTSTKKKNSKMAASHCDQFQHSSSTQLDCHQLASKTGSTQSLSYPSQSSSEFEALKIRSREMCCFGGIGGYQKLSKTALLSPSNQQPVGGHGDSSSPLPSDASSAENAKAKSSNGAEAAGLGKESSNELTSDVYQSKQYYSLDRYHAPPCRHYHQHNHQHRHHKKTKSGSQSASASPSSDVYGNYGPYAVHHSCCRHNYSQQDSPQQRYHYQHHHHHHQQQPQQLQQSPPKQQQQSPVKTSQHQQHPYCCDSYRVCSVHQQHCRHSSCRSLPETKNDGELLAGSNNSLLPVDLLNTSSGTNLNEKKSPPDLSTRDGSSSGEVETSRLRISQLENQLASLTQWVQESIEAERITSAAQGDIASHVKRDSHPQPLSADKSERLLEIKDRLGAMLNDVASLRDQCQHLKAAHQVQKREVQDTLVVFSQKIMAFVGRGMISEESLWTSLVQDFDAFQSVEYPKKREMVDRKATLLVNADLKSRDLKKADAADEMSRKSRTEVPTESRLESNKLDDSIRFNRTPKNVQGLSQNLSGSRTSGRVSISSSGDEVFEEVSHDSARSPDLVRSNRSGEGAFPKAELYHRLSKNSESSRTVPDNKRERLPTAETANKSEDIWLPGSRT